MTASQPIRVVVVEDSLLQRAHLVRVLAAGGDLVVVGEAATAEEAVEVVTRLEPDVVTMDLEIPGGRPSLPGGIVAIEGIVERLAVPVLVLSAHAASRAETLAMQALDAGAVDVFPKPASWNEEQGNALRRRVAVLSRVAVVRRRAPRVRAPRAADGGSMPIVGLAASTGGPSALREVLSGLRGLPAPILVVQHIHAEFTASFAQWLQEAAGIPTLLAEHGARPRPGMVYVAPPDTHMRIASGGAIALSPEPDLLSRPSCDELLRSLADSAKANAVAAVLTGMGDDGARGLLAVRQAGGATFAQDEATSVVDGMPRAARELGAADRALPLEEIAGAITAQIRRRTAG